MQESTKENPFFLLYGRDPHLPTESVLGSTNEAYLVDIEDYKSELLISLAKTQKLALENIGKTQAKQKLFYDKSTKNPAYKIGDRVMVFMPGDVTGKDWKLARPYHCPYRAVNVTLTNAEVQLIQSPNTHTLFVAISHLRRDVILRSQKILPGLGERRDKCVDTALLRSSKDHPLKT